MIRANRNLKHNIWNVEKELDTQIKIKEKANQEYNKLDECHNEINSKIDEIIIKIRDQLSSKFQDNSLMKDIYSDLLKVKERDFDAKSIDNRINQIWIQYINLIDESYLQVIYYLKLFWVFL